MTMRQVFMKKSEPITVKRISQDYRPIYRRLYFMACAVTGNEKSAERALICAMLSARPDDAEREIVRRAMEAKSEGEEAVDFDCLLGDEDENSPIADALCALGEEDRRALMLRYGLRLSAREISQAMGCAAGRTKRRLERALDEIRRASQCAFAEREIARLCALEMSASRQAPDFGTVLRAAENQLSSAGEPVKRARRIRGTVNWLSAIAALVVLGVMLWVCAILLDYFRQTYNEPKPTQVGTQMTITEDADARV